MTNQDLGLKWSEDLRGGVEYTEVIPAVTQTSTHDDRFFIIPCHGIDIEY